MRSGSGMFKKLWVVPLIGAMMLGGQAIPAGAQPSVPEDVASGDLVGDAASVWSDQTPDLLPWGDGSGGTSASSTTQQEQEEECKKIKNKKKRKKCMKNAQEEEPIVREVEFDYACPCPGVFQLGSLTGGSPNLGGGPIPVGGDDLYLIGIAADTSGTAISVDVNQDDGTGANASSGSFCGETEEPIELNPGMEIRIFIGDPAACPGSVALGGTITFTLSNLPLEDAPEEEAPE